MDDNPFKTYHWSLPRVSNHATPTHNHTWQPIPRVHFSDHKSGSDEKRSDQSPLQVKFTPSTFPPEWKRIGGIKCKVPQYNVPTFATDLANVLNGDGAMEAFYRHWGVLSLHLDLGVGMIHVRVLMLASDSSPLRVRAGRDRSFATPAFSDGEPVVVRVNFHICKDGGNSGNIVNSSNGLSHPPHPRSNAIGASSTPSALRLPPLSRPHAASTPSTAPSVTTLSNQISEVDGLSRQHNNTENDASKSQRIQSRPRSNAISIPPGGSSLYRFTPNSRIDSLSRQYRSIEDEASKQQASILDGHLDKILTSPPLDISPTNELARPLHTRPQEKSQSGSKDREGSPVSISEENGGQQKMTKRLLVLKLLTSLRTSLEASAKQERPLLLKRLMSEQGEVDGCLRRVQSW